MSNIDYSNVIKHKTNYLSFDEIDTMLQYCFDNERTRDYMLIKTLFHTGRRITEIVGEKPYTKKVGLRPCDITDDGLIEFDILKKNPIKTKRKNGQKRNVDSIKRDQLNKMPRRMLMAVDGEYYNLLREYIRVNNIPDHLRVFDITRVRAWYIISEVAEKSGITRSFGKIHPHSFRHSFAIYLLKSNPNDAATLKQLQDLLAHSDIKITMESYAKFTQDDKKEMLNRVFAQE